MQKYQSSWPVFIGRLQPYLYCTYTRHLQPTAYVSLLDLLGSPRSDMDIQSELVEILGFEGDGLALVEEVLRPEIRSALVVAERGGAVHKVCSFTVLEADMLRRSRLKRTRGVRA